MLSFRADVVNIVDTGDCLWQYRDSFVCPSQMVIQVVSYLPSEVVSGWALSGLISSNSLALVEDFGVNEAYTNAPFFPISLDTSIATLSMPLITPILESNLHTMDQNITFVDETPQMAFVNGNEAIKTVVSMLSPAAAAETASFMVDTSVCCALNPVQHQTTCPLPF